MTDWLEPDWAEAGLFGDKPSDIGPRARARMRGLLKAQQARMPKTKKRAKRAPRSDDAKRQ